MKAAIIVFPGSNCDRDIAVSFRNVAKVEPKMVWHKETHIPDCNIIIVPGGFSFGDYLRCGSIAANSPVMREVIKKSKEGFPIIGICNGFQILTETRLLPGTLIRNNCLSFICKTTKLSVVNNSTYFSQKYFENQIIDIPIAHNEGNYFANDEIIKELEDNNQIAFKYCDEDGNFSNDANPNGSLKNIAGIINKKGNVLGMMPHPERATNTLSRLNDGENFFLSIAETLQ
ncbi:MAG: phosphoribosylformylglycinamidine synthase subunit PurQ [Pseudomonadota bacterium]|nr:phosphoribosylformylglycinamidine synthase subunit PurQ [Pseudomonadota bacterium]